jgi:hypothetical protein
MWFSLHTVVDVDSSHTFLRGRPQPKLPNGLIIIIIIIIIIIVSTTQAKSILCDPVSMDVSS